MQDSETKRQVIEHALKALFAIASLAAVWWLGDLLSAKPIVAAPFTRVGGETRVETALEASTYWPDRAGVVTARAIRPHPRLWDRARCAIDGRGDPVPLLLMPARDPARTSVVERRQRELRAAGENAEPCRVDRQQIECPQDPDGAGWNVLDLGLRPLPSWAPTWLPWCDDVYGTVILATEKSRADAPDAALAVALAAGLAHGSSDDDEPRQVTVILLPRHPGLHPALEDALRARDEMVTSGIVVGQANRIFPETREAIRAILTHRGSPSTWQRFRESWADIEALVLALIGLWGLKHAAQAAAPALADGARWVFRVDPDRPGLRTTIGGIMTRVVERFKPQPERVDPAAECWEKLAAGPVRITLGTGRVVEGAGVDPPIDLHGVAMLRVREPRIRDREPDGALLGPSDARPGTNAGQEGRAPRLALVPWTDVVLIEQLEGAPPSGSDTGAEAGPDG